jgi:hypothetical protein
MGSQSNKGDLLVSRRFVTLALSSCLVLAVGIARVDQLFSQEVEKAAAPAPAAPAKTDAPKTDAPKTDAPKADPAKTDPAKKAETPKPAEAPKATEAPLPPIPKEVEVKLEAARKAVAELIVAAQDAGLVETSIEPPPILDILITGRATDTRVLKNPTAKKPYAVSPEVFGAWFTGFGKLEGVNYAEDLRIINPSDGLRQWYEQRARFLDHYIEEIRKAKGPAAATPKKDETKPAEAKKVDEPKKK